MVVFQKLSEQPGFSAEEHRKIGLCFGVEF